MKTIMECAYCGAVIECVVDKCCPHCGTDWLVLYDPEDNYITRDSRRSGYDYKLNNIDDILEEKRQESR